MPRVYLGRLSHHVREKDVERFFGGYGKLLEVDLKNGYGFVEFEDNRDADDAVYELNGKDLCGERVVIEHARGPRRDRDRDGYGGGSWGGGGGRSKCSLLQDTLSSLCPWGEVSKWTAHRTVLFLLKCEVQGLSSRSVTSRQLSHTYLKACAF